MIIPVDLLIANMAIVLGQKTVLVDNGTPNNAGRILRVLDRNHIDRKQVSLILLTHAHGDHAGSARELREILQVPVAVHQGDVGMLKRGDNGPARTWGWEAALSRPFVNRPFPGIDADVVLEEPSDLRAYGVDARWIHTPGHSPGSISILFPDGDAIVGDILRGGFLGGKLSPQRPAPPYFMADMADVPLLLSSIRRVLETGSQRLYTGHGGPLPRAAVERWLAAQRQQIEKKR